MGLNCKLVTLGFEMLLKPRSLALRSQHLRTQSFELCIGFAHSLKSRSPSTTTAHGRPQPKKTKPDKARHSQEKNSKYKKEAQHSLGVSQANYRGMAALRTR